MLFKYVDFALASLHKILSAFSVPFEERSLKLIAPLGISFFTFEAVSYLTDVYKGRLEPVRNLGIYAAYISFFPNISSGPIERGGDLIPMFEKEKKFSYDKAVYGTRLILLGLLKKMVFANSMAKYVNFVFDNVSAYRGTAFIVATFMYTFEIYCDFSGYTDMARGIAMLLGFDLTENFRTPYLSSSVKEFWARWHISLSSWLRDYVYIPLGGNRRGKLRKNLNLMITFLVSGLWHGASWTFVLWGAIHGICQVIEGFFTDRFGRKSPKVVIGNSSSLDQPLKKKKITAENLAVVLKTLLTFCIVSFAWMFFRANSISDALYILKNMSFMGNLGDAFTSMYMTKASVIKVTATIIFVTVYDLISRTKDPLKELDRLPLLIRWTVYVATSVLVIVLTIHNGVTAEFIYSRF